MEEEKKTAMEQQKFSFEADRDTVVTLFTGEQYYREITMDYAGFPVQVTLGAVPTDTGNTVILILVQFDDPKIIVSENSRLLDVAYIELTQSQKGKCEAVLHFPLDTYLVRPHIQGTRKKAYGRGRTIAARVWRQTLDEWLKRQPAGGAGAEQPAPTEDKTAEAEKPILTAEERIIKRGMKVTEARLKREKENIEIERLKDTHDPTVISKKLGLPVETVKSRIKKINQSSP